MIKTKIDELCELLENEKNREGRADVIAGKLGMDVEKVERIGKILQEKGAMELIYPVNLISKPSIRLIKVIKRKSEDKLIGEKYLTYSIEADKVPATISIMDIKGQSRPIYHITIPEIGAYTSLFLEYVRDELARSVSIQTDEIMDPRKSDKIKKRFYEAAEKLIKNELEIDEQTLNIFAGLLLHRMHGLGDIELLMADNWLEEVAINSSAQPLSVYHRKFGWLKTNIRINSEEEIYNYASQIGRKTSREINLFSPIMDTYLLSGDRITATLFPISSHGNTITIRRFARAPWTIIDFVDPNINLFSIEMAAFLWLCVQYEMNILIVGSTASGKTSTLNALCALIPPSQRIMTIEDTRELNLPSYLKWNWISLITRNPNPEGKGEVKMLDLMLSALRMRPDRVVVGEVRKRKEAEVLFEGMHTGHSVYSTLHSDTAQQALRRLTNPPIKLPLIELQSLHLLLVLYRDRRSGIRKMYEIGEVIGSEERISLNTLYKWNIKGDVFEKVGESKRIYEELYLHTGMSKDEIENDIKEKEKIMKWMLRHHIRSVDKIGELMGVYYKIPEMVIEATEKDFPPKMVIS